MDKVLEREALSDLMRLVREVPVASHVKDYAVRLVLATHPKTETAAPISNQYLRFGSSPRGGQTLHPRRQGPRPDRGPIQRQLR